MAVIHFWQPSGFADLHSTRYQCTYTPTSLLWCSVLYPPLKIFITP